MKTTHINENAVRNHEELFPNHITFHTAMSTAFAQPQPGRAPKAGPMKVPAEQLRSVLGVTSVNYVKSQNTLAVVDLPVAG